MFDIENISTGIDKPVDPADKDFKFSFQVGSHPDFLSQKIDYRNALASRLERLITEPTVDGHPYIQYLFKNIERPTSEELLILSKALERISQLIEPFRKLDEEVKGLVWARENAKLVACAFGDFPVPDIQDFLNP